MKLHKCKNPDCGNDYVKERIGQKACSLPCAIVVGRAERQAKQKTADRKEYREKKAAMRTRRDLLKIAQVWFNRFIRLRDEGKPCICCGRSLEAGAVGGGYDAGHYRSIGSAPHLRFMETNVHGQSKQCNRYGAGRAVDYRLGLIERVGLEEVERLEADNEPRKYSEPELLEIIETYKRKCKELKVAAKARGD